MSINETLACALPTEDARIHDTTPQLGWLDRRIRRQLTKRLGRIEQGQIEFADRTLSCTLGQPAKADDERLTATLHITDPRFYRQVATGGGLGFAEAYLRGNWQTDDLTTLLRILARNRQRMRFDEGTLTRLGKTSATAWHRLARNSRRGSRRNIASHYDLSNEFFAMFLDPTMMYSAAMFDEPGMTLEHASLNKLDVVCRKLDLQPDDHLLEIGTGWGGLALHAAQNYGCHVTTSTISQQQHDFAKQRFEDAGLADRVTLLQDDYRDLSGRFDKLVSIEMLEAVGHQYFDTYFTACNRLLKPGGRVLVQSITMPEQRYAAYLRSVEFIQEYIFPGGCLPSLAAVQQSVGRCTHLRLLEQSDFGHCYARTLREWRDRFDARQDDIRALGFDDRFHRMWEYYLGYCEAAFEERAVGVSQLMWVKV